MCFIRVVIYELFIKAPCDSNCCYKEKSKEQKDPLVLFPERILFGDDDEEEGKAFSFRLFVCCRRRQKSLRTPCDESTLFHFLSSLMLHINLDTSLACLFQFVPMDISETEM
jgi:hypothetical protein